MYFIWRNLLERAFLKRVDGGGEEQLSMGGGQEEGYGKLWEFVAKIVVEEASLSRCNNQGGEFQHSP